MDRNQPGVQDSRVSVFVLIRYHWARVACGLKPAQQPRAEDSTMSVFVLPNFNRRLLFVDPNQLKNRESRIPGCR